MCKGHFLLFVSRVDRVDDINLENVFVFASNTRINFDFEVVYEKDAVPIHLWDRCTMMIGGDGGNAVPLHLCLVHPWDCQSHIVSPLYLS